MKPLGVITFISGHYYPSARRAGFHNLADAAYRMGYKVNFVTVGYSLLSYLRRDYRTRIRGIRANLNRAVEIRPGFVSYVYATVWHPMTFLVPAVNRLTMSMMDGYGQGRLGALLPIVRETDIFVFESTPGLFLFRRFQRENPDAKMIYRVSDDVRILRSTHPRLVELEQEIAPLFHTVSVPCAWMLGKFPGLPTLRCDRHGLDTAAFDAVEGSPYEAGTKNAIFVGTGYVDLDCIASSAEGVPECNFHIIGPMKDTLNLKNVIYYGEIPFRDTLPYIKHADVGLGTRDYREGFSASLTDSLKILQYRYCGLPIVSPDFIDLARDGVFYYQPRNAASCVEAMKGALSAGKDISRGDEVQSWDEVMQSLLDAVTIN